MATSALRMQTYRTRQQSGRVILPVEVDETALVAALIDACLLDPSQADDREAVTKATTRLIEVFCGEWK